MATGNQFQNPSQAIRMPGRSVTDLDCTLDVFGQQPGLNLYTQICLCFPVPDASSHSAVIDTLAKGLGRLTASFPWIAGQIVNEGANRANPGVFRIKSFNSIPPLVVKDHRNDPSVPTWNAIKQAGFPASMLDEALLCPRSTFPGVFDYLETDSIPVFIFQANFISGGLLLIINANHQAMDMTGQGHVMYLLSKACHETQFTDEELSIGNLDRRQIIPLLDASWKPGSELDHQIMKPEPSYSTAEGPSTNTEPVPPLKCTWAYFTFHSTALAALKSLAMKHVYTGYVSTDDTISAFIWQAVMRARLPRLDPEVKATFARAVDPRRYVNIPATYPGLVQNMAYNSYTIQELCDAPLGEIASQLRSSVDPSTSNMGYRTRALATLLDRTLDKNVVNVTATLDLSRDIMLSSWVKEKCYDLDFNLGLGKPECVRRPQFTPVESLFYLMPKAPSGEIAALLCLRDEDMMRLRADEEFLNYANSN